MKNSISSIFENSYYNPKEIIDLDKIEKELKSIKYCPNCENNEKNTIKNSVNKPLKKFKAIEDQINLEDVDNNFGRCKCGKRPLDLVMTHVLKIMIEEGIDLRKNTLRNGAIPLITPFTSNPNMHKYVSKNSMVILHPKLTKDIANKIIAEINEVKGVLKGNSNDTVGIKDSNSEAIFYNLLAGDDIRCDIIKIPNDNNSSTNSSSNSQLNEYQKNNETIAINKIQHLTYLEFPPSIETKINKVSDYLNSYGSKEIAKLNILDGTCGNGSIGIFLLKKGTNKVIFTDIWKPATFMTAVNLKANGFETNFLTDFEDIKAFEDNNNNNNNNKDNYENIIKIATGNNFEVYNLPIEELKTELEPQLKEETTDKYFDICILDCFPNTDVNNFEKVAKTLAKDVLII